VIAVARAVLIASLASACAPEEAAPPPPTARIRSLPPLDRVTFTDERTLQPKHELLDPPDRRRPSAPNDRAAMLAEGYGEYETAPGWPHVARTPNGDRPPASGASPKLLVRFVHLADLQLADDESPARFAATDDPGTFRGSYRPQDFAMCAVIDAAVRTIGAIHERTPLSFVLLGGDNLDNAQGNELEWMMSILAGREVDCDSGADDELDPGDDAKDRFAPVGLPVPWYWVTGNHDVLVQGVIALNDDSRARAVGSDAALGTRDWRLPGGPVMDGEVPADPRRALLDRPVLMERVQKDGDGHGLGESAVITGRAEYSFDIEETPLRFMVLDTAAETGGSEGVIHQRDVDRFIRPELDRAARDGKWVILASHHSAGAIGDGTAFGGTYQEDAITYDDWVELVGAHRNVLFGVAAHSHTHRVRFLEGGARGWWEIRTSALAEHPQQMRLIEIWDQDNGWLMLKATCVDYASEGDPISEEARKLAILDRVAGWWWGGEGDPDERNVELWIEKP
jgi:hypothetical protein